MPDYQRGFCAFGTYCIKGGRTNLYNSNGAFQHTLHTYAAG